MTERRTGFPIFLFHLLSRDELDHDIDHLLACIVHCLLTRNLALEELVLFALDDGVLKPS